MRKKHFLFGVLFVALASCSDKERDEEVYTENVPQNQSGSYYRISSLKSVNHSVSIEEAEKSAKEVMAAVFSNSNGLKSAISKDVANVVVIKASKSSLKAHNPFIPDTLAYVVNFADSAGFALVSADDRVPYPVLACLEKGNYSSMGNNLCLNMMLKRSEQFIQSSIIDFENNKEDCLAYLAVNGEPESEGRQLKESSIVGPYLTTKWGQGAPYNGLLNCTDPGCTKKAKTGCFPTALAQVMTYWECPKNKFPWFLFKRDLTIGNGQQFLAKMHYLQELMKWLGEACDAEYTCHGTSAGLTWTKTGSGPWHNNWLTSMGYDNEFIDYSWSELKKVLDKGPSMMCGTDSEEGGHAWVADGYKHIHYTIPVVYSTPVGNKSATANADIYFIHNNWGWDGQNNGYFVRDCFNVANASEFDKPSSNNQTFNFTKELKIIKMFPK